MKIPFLVSDLPAMAHPQMEEVVNDMKEYFKTDVFNISNQNTQLYGDYIAAGGQYTSYVYPFGNVEKLKAISRYYSYWVVIDDQDFDDSVDLAHIIRTFEGFQAALNEQSVPHKMFRPIAEFCSRTDWTNEAKDIFRREMNRYLENVVKQRTIEIQKREVSLEEYLQCRAFDVAMCVMFSMLWYAQGDMPLAPYYDGEFEKVLEYSGLSMGLLLDLYTFKSRKKEIKQYAHAIRIIQRVENCDEQEAINRGVRLFYEYESELEEEFNRLEEKYPLAVRYFRYLQSGTIKYCNENRKIRYLQDYEMDENLVNGRTII
jgi:hypothetical protein